jgi:hypothetical protein
MRSGRVKRLKALEVENARLRRAVSDLTLDKLILKEAARGNFYPRPSRACVQHVKAEFGVSERRACAAPPLPSRAAVRRNRGPCVLTPFCAQRMAAHSHAQGASADHGERGWTHEPKYVADGSKKNRVRRE